VVERESDPMPEMSSTGSPREPVEQFAALVVALIESDFVDSRDWTAWALDELLRAEGAPPWLAELTTTYGINDALALIYPVSGRPSPEDRLGCLWLSFTQRSRPSIELFEAALEAVGGWDTGGAFNPYQQALMRLLRRVESLSRWSLTDSFERIERDGHALLRPLGERVLSRTAERISLSRRR
jgi:hypothetical protein